MEDDEKAACAKRNIKYEEVQVANDGLSVVVNRENDWANCLSVAQLKNIWQKGSKINNWKQVDPKFPDRKMRLFGAGTDSGTFEYFTRAINDEEGNSRSNYQATEDDNVTVQRVAGDKGAIGYFGLSYYEQNKDTLKDVQIKDGNGTCVTPNAQTVQSGEYQNSALKRPEVKAFVEFYINNQAQLTRQALFVPMTPEQLKESQDEVKRLAADTHRPDSVP